jgi:hypothetical protein
MIFLHENTKKSKKSKITIERVYSSRGKSGFFGCSYKQLKDELLFHYYPTCRIPRSYKSITFSRLHKSEVGKGYVLPSVGVQ